MANKNKIKVRGIIGKSYAEIGRKLGLSREWIRQLATKYRKVGNMIVIEDFPYSKEIYNYFYKFHPNVFFQKRNDRLLVLREKSKGGRGNKLTNP